jgi:ATP/maltotriose-dependent transcriptional regulator MalT
MSEDAVALGQAALGAAEWQKAHDAFAKALEADAEHADALDGLGQALWWSGDWPRGRALRERAFALYRAGGRVVEAARTAMWIANEYLVATGNRAAWNGWLERTAGLLKDMPPCAEHGWLVITRGRRAEDANACATACTEALVIAREHGDIDLEVFALSQLGRALVTLGRAEEGFARLDEAMVAVTAGEPRSFFTVCDTCCNMLTTCESAVEFERLTQWGRVTEDVSRRLKGGTLYAVCRFAYAGVLMATGRWVEAEQELDAGIEGGARAYPSYVTNHVMTKLAELRVMQGRLEEAEELLTGCEESAAARVTAALRIAKGEAAAAARLIERRLPQIQSDDVQEASFLALLVRARLALDDMEGASAAAAKLEALAAKTNRSASIAEAKLALGQVALARGATETAWALLDEARERYVALEMPFHAAQARLAIARALRDDDRDEALDIARAVRADLEKLGAARDAAAAAELLRELGVGTGPGKRAGGTLSTREEEVLTHLAGGLSNAEIGARLFISPKTVEHHVGRILSKLGLKSRSAAAAYLVKRRADSGRK